MDLRGRGLILVVDDERVVRQMASQALERYGYQVLVAGDGARGLEIFQREATRIHAWCWTYDAGYERRRNPPRMKTVLAEFRSCCRAASRGEAVRRFEGKGLAGFLQKPYKASMLLEMVKRVMLQPESGGTAAAGGNGDWQ